MTYVGSSFRSVPLVRPMQFRGSPSSSKAIIPTGITNPASSDEFVVPTSPTTTESDASSIRTNPETLQVMSDVQHTLDELEGKISDEQLAILRKGVNHFQTEITRKMHSGRKWQSTADSIGTEHEFVSGQLDEKTEELRKAQQAKLELEQEHAQQEQKLARKLTEVSNLRQSKLEVERNYARQGRKLRDTEQELKDHLQDLVTIDEQIERLSQEAKEIKQKLDLVIEQLIEQEPGENSERKRQRTAE